jgi:hypothetical protein
MGDDLNSSKTNPQLESVPPASARLSIQTPSVICRVTNSIVMVLLFTTVFLAPAFIVSNDLRDERIRTGGIPASAWNQHRALSGKYANWARQRLASDRGLELSTDNISGTEWPLFGSVFYLWATEALQEEWDARQFTFAAPKVYSSNAIEAATALVIDPKQAGWVQKHWGTNYLTRENAFYRMLVIAALTSHARLTGDRSHQDLLRSQVEGLSNEIATSSHGLLDDYPGQCYPGDVLTAIAVIRKADQVLGTDHSEFCAQAIRGFQGPRLDRLGLVPYAGDSRNGVAIGPSRGCGNSYVSLAAPTLWPEQAKKWYELYEENFWQEGSVMSGYREFHRQMTGTDWYADVDSGPVIGGIGFAASAFGVGAARVNGRFDHAYPLTAELYATSWPLPNRTLLMPRILSNAADAPYLGEAAILFVLTRPVAPGLAIRSGGSIPRLVAIIVGTQLLIGLIGITMSTISLRRWLRNRPSMIVLGQMAQFKVWIALILTALVTFLIGKMVIAFILMLVAQFFPRCRKPGRPTPAALIS